MASISLDDFEKLDIADRKKVEHFVQLLLRQEKYKSLKKELEERRDEVSKGETLSHDEFWNEMNV